MASGGDERAAAQGHGNRPWIAWIFLLERMPVVGLGVNHVPEHAVGLELLDGYELWVPAQNEGCDALHLRIADGLVDAAHSGIVECDRLFDDHMTTGLGCPLELGGTDVWGRA